MRLLNVADYRRAARRRLPRGLFDYVDRGSEDEIGLAGLRRSFDNIKLLPRVLRDVSQRNLSVELFGKRLPCPLIIAPTAVAGLLWHDGEVALARAAARAGIPLCLSTQSMASVEDIAQGAPDANLWFQLYVWQDRDLTRALIERVAAAGVTTLVLTADTPVVPKREYNIRNGFGIPVVPSLAGGIDVAMHPRWLWCVLLRYIRERGMPVYGNYPAAYRQTVTRGIVAERVKLAERLTWDDVAALRDCWQGKLLVKGILHVDDARQAARLGVDGIVVSTHGGRNLDSAPCPVDVLAQITEAVGHELTVLADSGVRRGSDAVKLVGLGARAVLLGRSVLYGLAVGGEDGASQVLKIIEDEISGCLAFLGQPSMGELAGDLIFRQNYADGG